MKKEAFCIIITCFIFLCNGCYFLEGSGKGLDNDDVINHDISKLQSQSDNPRGHYELETENLKINIDMIVPEELKLTQSTAVKNIPQEDMPLIKEKYITEEWKEEVSEGVDENGEEVETYIWNLGPLGNPEKSIYISSYWIDMYLDMDAIQKENAAFRKDGYDNANEELYATGREFPFMGIQDSLNQAVMELEEIGVPLGPISYYQCFSLDAETMKKQECLLDADGNKIDIGIIWTEQDNYYRFFARQSFQELPIYYADSEWGSGLDKSCMPIQMLIGEGGLCNVSLEKTFSFVEGQEPITLLDTDDIVESVIAKYSELLTENKFSINNAELMYFAKKEGLDEYTLIPVWLFEVVERYNDENIGWHMLILNAQTGKEVPTE